MHRKIIRGIAAGLGSAVLAGVAVAGSTGAGPAFAAVSSGTAVGATAPAAAALELMPAPLVQKQAQAALSALAVRQAHAAQVAREKRLAATRKAALIAREKAVQRAARAKARAALAKRDPRSIARAMVAAKGWGAGQFSCLNKLWIRESNWRVRAENRSSGAYGIPQALPGRKMASAGSDWRTNPATQIKWGLGYIKSRYGTPCGAWASSQSRGWY